MSDWNDYFDRVLQLRLGTEEHRLADALARNLLGFRRLEDRIGESLLREASGLHGRSFERAREGLVAKGLIHFEAGRRGRGGVRGLYRMILRADENPLQGGNSEPEEKPAIKPALKPAPARVRREQSAREEHSALPPSRQKRRDSTGWPPGLGQRTLGDLLAACELVENIKTGIDGGTLRAFVVDELALHDAADFERVLDRLFEKRARGGVGTPAEPIRDEAAFARHLLHDIAAGYE